ncbi:hypothetical protein K469DRAFT_758547 [Zopfia rhizophila CBS 207.26]|uniref:ferric-chelate reductase (NADPH) n=1 Tax=Zopfia rhizophila CBS 207.26 TaxID=1314779 RepID=A0A6A6EUB0_9PEZI|nr:hypothetical protein K469DRAFT_758547 [Zopfia rhizophila CBS 207.26]
MSFPLLIFHIIIVVASRTPFPLHVAENMWGLVGGSSLCLLLLLSYPLLRKPSYEIFLRVHRVLAVLSAFSIWRHLALLPFLSCLYVYSFAIMFLSMLLLQSAHFLYQNKAMGASLSQAYIIHNGNTIKIRLSLSRPLKVEAGQYIGLWIPEISFWSFLQSHPFTVTSWSEGKQEYLDLLIEPVGEVKRMSCLALFSGPHGISMPAGDYETVLMIASGFGVAAQLPYIRQPIYGYNACKTQNRRVHLAWQLETGDITTAVEPLLNAALHDDTLDEGKVSTLNNHVSEWPANREQILSVSTYVGSGTVSMYGEPFGKRAILYKGSADLGMILKEERAVSAADVIRDEVWDLVRDYLDDKVTMFELEYQPA